MGAMCLRMTRQSDAPMDRSDSTNEMVVARITLLPGNESRCVGDYRHLHVPLAWGRHDGQVQVRHGRPHVNNSLYDRIQGAREAAGNLTQGAPAPVPSMTESKPTCKETRAAWATRRNTSRPNSSVPTVESANMASSPLASNQTLLNITAARSVNAGMAVALGETKSSSRVMSSR